MRDPWKKHRKPWPAHQIFAACRTCRTYDGFRHLTQPYIGHIYGRICKWGGLYCSFLKIKEDLTAIDMILHLNHERHFFKKKDGFFSSHLTAQFFRRFWFVTALKACLLLFFEVLASQKYSSCLLRVIALFTSLRKDFSYKEWNGDANAHKNTVEPSIWYPIKMWSFQKKLCFIYPQYVALQWFLSLEKIINHCIERSLGGSNSHITKIQKKERAIHSRTPISPYNYVSIFRIIIFLFRLYSLKKIDLIVGKNS